MAAAAAGASGGGSKSVTRSRKLPSIELKKPISEMQGKEYVHTLFSDPASCKMGRLYMFAMNVTVFVSTWVLVIETLFPKYSLIWFLMDTSFVSFFTFDLLVRSLTAPDQRNFWTDPLNWIDFITTFPYFIQPGAGLMYNTTFGMQRCLRAFRHMKMIKVTKYGPVMIALEVAMVKSLAALIVPIFYMGLALVVLSSLEYFIEMEQGDGMEPNNAEDEGWDPFNRPTFDDLPSAIWWCLVTMTGTGYGDMYPATWKGMIIAASTAAIGVFFIAMPFAVAGGSFWHAWSVYTEQRELLRLMKEGDTAVELSPDELGFQAPREISLLSEWYAGLVRFADISGAKTEDDLMPDEKVQGSVEQIERFVDKLVDMLDVMHEEKRKQLVIRAWNRQREAAIEHRLPVKSLYKDPEFRKLYIEIADVEASKAAAGSSIPYHPDEGGSHVTGGREAMRTKDEEVMNPMIDDSAGHNTTGKLTGEATAASNAHESRAAAADALLQMD